jgi:aminoglycoside phosphotransferase (APT) family kinase protein
VHANEIRATPEQVGRLIAKQFPEWDGLPLAVLDRQGTDHVLFRLGDELLVRMPKIDWAADQAVTDARWLPRLAPNLPVRIPAPVGVGEPDEGFPWQWTVVPWIAGDNPGVSERSQPSLAREVAAFVRALQAVDRDGAPLKTGRSRGTPLAPNDDAAQAALRELASHDDGIDLDAVARAWDDAVTAPVWDQPPVWIHSDIQPGNLILDGGRLAAVIDFGGLGLGDPAPDVAAAFWTFRGAARSTYRDELGYDDATWRRARGWALLPSLTGLNYYRHTFPRMVAHSRDTIAAVLEDVREAD